MQPAPAPPLPREAAAARTVRPSAWWFLAAGLVAVAGIVVGIVGAVRTFGDWLDRVDGLERTSVPGSMTVEIDEPGGYSIYVESERRTADPELLDNPVVDVLDPSGDFVPLDPYGSSVTYTTPSHRGRGAFTFQAEEPGTYEVTASGSSGTVVAVGRGIGDLLVSGLGRSVAVGLLGPLVGGATALVVGVRR
ncbi:MAG TPA: hypothetical protein VFI47_24560, partial [Acidimicrobiales bacterium]|nr:hypothetical protein [Acidimicrobiales bacterium]